MLKWLITVFIALLVLGLMTPVLQRLGWGRLPGDITVNRKKGTFYFPFASVVLASALLSLIVWLLGR